ncbi:holo-ACP synthase [Ornithinibacillus halophilus]|uniref:Holo-[acyl-carrier-protein] synthase n=1 Tax=Ornithinibacillus halophilus TaxID=930117 RepID=A0A1M5IVC6_9BACI|nr:holo-ACP synthase [Ornithinibacillus halophilus]SHG32115.1 holo-[acyl-carrier-protein] synthase [Ornithinibacillus halophilus]
MIKGIGIDIIELERIKKSMKKEAFLIRILTEKEREQFYLLRQESRQVEFVAGRFAAKEAFSKATGTGIGELSFQDIEVLNAEHGAPIMIVEKYKDDEIHVSISHSKEFAVAQVILEQK